MSELGDRIKELRRELKELRDGGIQSNFNVTSVEQQLDRIEDRINSKGFLDTSSSDRDEIPTPVRDRLNSRLDRIEGRIEEARRE